MGDLTDNLSRYEMACSCGCGFDTVDTELVNALQDACDHFGFLGRHQYYGVILQITGPNRCEPHNDALRELWEETDGEEGANTAVNTKHRFARAADHKLFWRLQSGKRGPQIPADDVADYYEKKYPDKYGVGRYSNRTHLDTRTDGPARWQG